MRRCLLGPPFLETALACHHLADHRPVLLSLFPAVSSPGEVFPESSQVFTECLLDPKLGAGGRGK